MSAPLSERMGYLLDQVNGDWPSAKERSATVLMKDLMAKASDEDLMKTLKNEKTNAEIWAVAVGGLWLVAGALSAGVSTRAFTENVSILQALAGAGAALLFIPVGQWAHNLALGWSLDLIKKMAGREDTK